MITTTNKDIIPIAILGQYEKDDFLYPAAKILNEDQNVAFDPAFVAGSLVSLYDAFLNHVPENLQIDFEEQFQFHFKSMFQVKDQYMIKLNDNSKTN